MTDPNLIPPKTLVDKWVDMLSTYSDQQVFTEVSQWASDIELDACIQWMVTMGYWGEDGKAIPALRAARRPSPKPPSLKGQALEQLDCVEGILRNLGVINTDTIRRAVEALPE